MVGQLIFTNTTRFAGLHQGSLWFDFMLSSYFYSQQSVKLLLLSLSFLNSVHFVSSSLFFQKLLSNFFLFSFSLVFINVFFSPFHFLKYLLCAFHIQTQYIQTEYLYHSVKKSRGLLLQSALSIMRKSILPVILQINLQYLW